MSRSLVFILVFITLIRVVVNYRYVLIPRDSKFDRCRNKTCEDGELHSICLATAKPMSSCVGYNNLEMTARRKGILINGHNGIRNKMAKQWDIANMLILHWDNDLAAMAKGYLKRCKIDKDSCNYLYNDTFTVAQTYYFNPKMPLNRFIITIMRHWFLEVNEISDFVEFLKLKPPNMTVMIYPRTEFFGCSAAEMFGGYMLRCYYSPGADLDPKAYIIGKPCSACPEERASCSRIFKGLCGLDLYVPTGKGALISANIMLLSLILFHFLHKLKS